MAHDPLETYPPLNTLKPVAKDLWIVDGPVIKFGPLGLRMKFPTRMTIMGAGARDLLIHSPTPLSAQLRAEIAQIGIPRWIVGPNRIHYWWIPDWHAAFNEADIYLAPRIREQAGDRIRFPSRTLDAAAGYPWDDSIDTLSVTGRYMTEVVFFHRASKTLVLTDLIENFEPAKLGSRAMRWLVKLGGADGGMPRDLRMTFAGRRQHLQAAIRRMIAWNPERIIVAHGQWYERNGADELRRVFRWLLD
ncbi:DUF4336 domain-containing protein [soil metagenome]